MNIEALYGCLTEMSDLQVLPKEKFSDPRMTMKGETRAWVRYEGTKTLWFNTGTLCNIECINCYIESSPTNDRLVYLTVADVVPYLDELAEAGEHNIEIAFTGGEPFLAPEMVAIIEAVVTRGHKVLVLTNAMKPLMRPRVQKGLKATLIPYDQRFEMGHTLAEARKAVPLNHPYCATFCVLGGGSCSA